MGINRDDYDESPREFFDEITSHFLEVIDERASWGKSFTAWDSSVDEPVNISVRGRGGVWFATGGEQFSGYFLCEGLANKSADLSTECFPLPEQ